MLEAMLEAILVALRTLTKGRCSNPCSFQSLLSLSQFPYF
jgi:hypothetical protein